MSKRWKRTAFLVVCAASLAAAEWGVVAALRTGRFPREDAPPLRALEDPVGFWVSVALAQVSILMLALVLWLIRKQWKFRGDGAAG
jgi:hypothetical protein